MRANECCWCIHHLHQPHEGLSCPSVDPSHSPETAVGDLEELDYLVLSGAPSTDTDMKEELSSVERRRFTVSDFVSDNPELKRTLC